MKAQRPFTVAWVREAIESLGDGYRVPPERGLEYMASRLNGKFYFYMLKDQASASAARASEVRNALKVLARFHADRWKELLAASHIPPDIVERETQLRDKFNAYRVEMNHWRFSRSTDLPIDCGLLFAPAKSWHDIVESIADLFAEVMKESNPGKPFGNWEGGPVVRFTTAALNLIGALPPANRLEDLYPRVAKHLRVIKAKKRK